MKIEKDVSLEELEAFIMFKVYYQLACCLVQDKMIMKEINNIMDYHYEAIYGKEYNSDKDITDYDFKVSYTINN